MPELESKRISRDRYDAVLFDLDGVITNTASLHATCWKQMFDEYLRKRAEQGGEAFRPFDLATDYRLYVDGKPRFAGVRDFLSSRSIQLPEGNLNDPAELDTVCGPGIARTIWLMSSSNAWGWSLTREACDSSVSCAGTGSRSLS